MERLQAVCEEVVDQMKKYRGVRPDGGKWRAYIGHNKKIINLGSHCTAFDAARAYDKAAVGHHGIKAKLNFGRMITEKEEQIYRLVSPDFFGLTYTNAAKLMHMSKDGIFYAIRRMRKKCPSLFPMRNPFVGVPMRYELWMDSVVKQKF